MKGASSCCEQVAWLLPGQDQGCPGQSSDACLCCPACGGSRQWGAGSCFERVCSRGRTRAVQDGLLLVARAVLLVGGVGDEGQAAALRRWHGCSRGRMRADHELCCPVRGMLCSTLYTAGLGSAGLAAVCREDSSCSCSSSSSGLPPQCASRPGGSGICCEERRHRPWGRQPVLTHAAFANVWSVWQGWLHDEARRESHHSTSTSGSPSHLPDVAAGVSAELGAGTQHRVLVVPASRKLAAAARRLRADVEQYALCLGYGDQSLV